MGVSRMLHFNSPEEVAKRAAATDVPSGKGFRHYNSPEEIAKRQRQAGSQPREDIVVRAPDETQPAPVPADPGAEGGSLRHRVQKLEALLLVFLRDPAEAREFRRLLNNAGAVEEVQSGINRRVRSLEQTMEQVLDAIGESSSIETSEEELSASDEPAGDEPAEPAPSEPVVNDLEPPATTVDEGNT